MVEGQPANSGGLSYTFSAKDDFSKQSKEFISSLREIRAEWEKTKAAFKSARSPGGNAQAQVSQAKQQAQAAKQQAQAAQQQAAASKQAAAAATVEERALRRLEQARERVAEQDKLAKIAADEARVAVRQRTRTLTLEQEALLKARAAARAKLVEDKKLIAAAAAETKRAESAISAKGVEADVTLRLLRARREEAVAEKLRERALLEGTRALRQRLGLLTEEEKAEDAAAKAKDRYADSVRKLRADLDALKEARKSGLTAQRAELDAQLKLAQLEDQRRNLAAGPVTANKIAEATAKLRLEQERLQRVQQAALKRQLRNASPADKKRFVELREELGLLTKKERLELAIKRAAESADAARIKAIADAKAELAILRQKQRAAEVQLQAELEVARAKERAQRASILSNDRNYIEAQAQLLVDQARTQEQIQRRAQQIARQQGIVLQTSNRVARTYSTQNAQLQQALRNLGNIDVLGQRIGRTFRNAFAFILIFQGLNQARQAFSDLIRSGFVYNAQLQQAELGIAGLILATRELGRQNEQLTSGPEQFENAYELAREQIVLLRQDALRTAATLEELQDAFQVTVAPAAQAGFNLDETRKFTVLISQAAAAIGLAQNQLAEEARSILQGTINPRNTRIATALGISNADIRRARESGELYDFLTAKLDAFRVASERAANSLPILAKNTAAAARELLRRGFEDAFVRLEDRIRSFKAQLVFESEDGIFFNPQIVAALDKFGDSLGDIIDRLAGFIANIGGGDWDRAFEGLGVALENITALLLGLIEGFALIPKVITGVLKVFEALFGGYAADIVQWAAFLGAGAAATFLLGKAILALTLGIQRLVVGTNFAIGRLSKLFTLLATGRKTFLLLRTSVGSLAGSLISGLVSLSLTTAALSLLSFGAEDAAEKLQSLEEIRQRVALKPAEERRAFLTESLAAESQRLEDLQVQLSKAQKALREAELPERPTSRGQAGQRSRLEAPIRQLSAEIDKASKKRAELENDLAKLTGSKLVALPKFGDTIQSSATALNDLEAEVAKLGQSLKGAFSDQFASSIVSAFAPIDEKVIPELQKLDQVRRELEAQGPTASFIPVVDANQLIRLGELEQRRNDLVRARADLIAGTIAPLIAREAEEVEKATATLRERLVSERANIDIQRIANDTARARAKAELDGFEAQAAALERVQDAEQRLTQLRDIRAALVERSVDVSALDALIAKRGSEIALLKEAVEVEKARVLVRRQLEALQARAQNDTLREQIALQSQALDLDVFRTDVGREAAQNEQTRIRALAEAARELTEVQERRNALLAGNATEAFSGEIAALEETIKLRGEELALIERAAQQRNNQLRAQVQADADRLRAQLRRETAAIVDPSVVSEAGQAIDDLRRRLEASTDSRTDSIQRIRDSIAEVSAQRFLAQDKQSKDFYDSLLAILRDTLETTSALADVEARRVRNDYTRLVQSAQQQVQELRKQADLESRLVTLQEFRSAAASNLAQQTAAAIRVRASSEERLNALLTERRELEAQAAEGQDTKALLAAKNEQIRTERRLLQIQLEGIRASAAARGAELLASRQKIESEIAAASLTNRLEAAGVDTANQVVTAILAQISAREQQAEAVRELREGLTELRRLEAEARGEGLGEEYDLAVERTQALIDRQQELNRVQRERESQQFDRAIRALVEEAEAAEQVVAQRRLAAQVEAATQGQSNELAQSYLDIVESRIASEERVNKLLADRQGLVATRSETGQDTSAAIAALDRQIAAERELQQIREQSATRGAEEILRQFREQTTEVRKQVEDAQLRLQLERQTSSAARDHLGVVGALRSAYQDYDESAQRIQQSIGAFSRIREILAGAGFDAGADAADRILATLRDQLATQDERAAIEALIARIQTEKQLAAVQKQTRELRDQLDVKRQDLLAERTLSSEAQTRLALQRDAIELRQAERDRVQEIQQSISELVALQDRTTDTGELAQLDQRLAAQREELEVARALFRVEQEILDARAQNLVAQSRQRSDEARTELELRQQTLSLERFNTEVAAQRAQIVRAFLERQRAILTDIADLERQRAATEAARAAAEDGSRSARTLDAEVQSLNQRIAAQKALLGLETQAGREAAQRLTRDLRLQQQRLELDLRSAELRAAAEGVQTEAGRNALQIAESLIQIRQQEAQQLRNLRAELTSLITQQEVLRAFGAEGLFNSQADIDALRTQIGLWEQIFEAQRRAVVEAQERRVANLNLENKLLVDQLALAQLRAQADTTRASAEAAVLNARAQVVETQIAQRREEFELQQQIGELEARRQSASGLEADLLNSELSALRQKLAITGQLYRVELDRLRVLQEEAQLQATGSFGQGLLRGAENYAERIGTEFQQGAQLAENIFQTLASQITSILSGAIRAAFDPNSNFDIGDALRGLAAALGETILQALVESVVAGIAKAIAELAVKKATVNAASTLIFPAASGGLVPDTGGRPIPGLPPSDTTLAALTPGEFVVPRDVVRNVGFEFFENLRRNGRSISRRPGSPRVNGIAGYAAGGQVQAATRSSGRGGVGVSQAIMVSDRQALDRLLHSSNRRSLTSMMQRFQPEFRRALGV